jgi:hypothetical protein
MRKELKKFIGPEGKRELVIFQSHGGLFYFQEFFEAVEDLRPFGGGVETFWSPGWQSGLNEMALEAERDAVAMTPWLRSPSA